MAARSASLVIPALLKQFVTVYKVTASQEAASTFVNSKMEIFE